MPVFESGDLIMGEVRRGGGRFAVGGEPGRSGSMALAAAVQRRKAGTDGTSWGSR